MLTFIDQHNAIKINEAITWPDIKSCKKNLKGITEAKTPGALFRGKNLRILHARFHLFVPLVKRYDQFRNKFFVR